MSTAKKCVSQCKHLSKYDCATKRKCTRTKSTEKMRPYCRLSRRYTMKKNDNCKLLRKYSKKEAIQTIGNFMNNARMKKAKLKLDEEQQLKKDEEQLILDKLKRNTILDKLKRNTSAKRITKFFKNTSNRRRSLFLKSICSDSGVCVAFGKEINKIKEHFDGFVNFKYLTNVKQIGVPSNNGFVKLLTYKNDGYVGNAILKSAVSERTDNLYYEYLVGLFLNKQSYWLPSFVETYGVYAYKTREDQRAVKESNSVEKVKESLVNTYFSNNQYINLHKSCDESSRLAILIQSFVGATTLHEALTNATDYFVAELCIIHLTSILFQIYMTLYFLKSVFTHYDLHTGNVLLYKPVNNSYIKYMYHLEDGTVATFNSPYIVKIIDYGRCFFNDTSVPITSIIRNSESIHRQVCKIPACEPKCGENKGYQYFSNKINAGDHYISSKNNNQSHDLRLLKMICDMKISIMPQIPLKINEMLNNVVFTGKYGTDNDPKISLTDKVTNVSKAADTLLNIIRSPEYTGLNTLFYETNTYMKRTVELKQLGELHIYYDKTPMKFIPSS